MGLLRSQNFGAGLSGLFAHEPDAYSLWEYRRIQQPAHFYPDYFAHGCAGDGISIVNWPQMDYWLGPLTGVFEAEKQKHIEGSTRLSLSLLYWMQTEAPRPDGGTGWLFTKRTKDAGLLFEVTVIGDAGTISYSSDTEKICVWTSDETKEIECDDLGKHFERVHTAFAASLRAGKLLGLASGEDGLKATEAAYQALSSTQHTS